MNRILLAVLLLPAAVLPVRAQIQTETLDRSTPVQPGAPRPFQVPPVTESSLKTGLRLAVAEVRRLPLVSVRLVLPLGGSAFDPSGRAGLAGFVAAVMREGPAGMTARKFSEKVDDLGVSIGVETGADAMTATVFTTKENLGKALSLLSAMVRSPAFRDEDLARLQEETLSGLEQEKGSPGALAERRLSTRVFGPHPYGAQADAASVASITPADVKAFHAARVRPEGAVLAVSGDIDLKELESLARKHFGRWKGAPGAAAAADVPALPETDPAAPSSGLVIDVVDMPGAQQSAIRAGHRSIPRAAPDYFATALMNFVLGQAPILSRLEGNLRERNGWAYAAGSSVSALKKGGFFAVEADVQTDATAKALQEVLKEMSRMQSEAVPSEELEACKRLMAGLFVLRQQTVQSIAGQVAGIELYGLPKDTLATYRDKVMAVTAEQVQQAAKDHLRPDALEIVIAGDAAKIAAELSAIAPVRIFDVEGNPKSSS